MRQSVNFQFAICNFQFSMWPPRRFLVALASKRRRRPELPALSAVPAPDVPPRATAHLPYTRTSMSRKTFDVVQLVSLPSATFGTPARSIRSKHSSSQSAERFLTACRSSRRSSAFSDVLCLRAYSRPAFRLSSSSEMVTLGMTTPSDNASRTTFSSFPSQGSKAARGTINHFPQDPDTVQTWRCPAAITLLPSGLPPPAFPIRSTLPVRSTKNASPRL